MKLTAKVTALRTNGRMEITIVTSATGLEQCITADNDGYSLDQELVLLVLTKEQAAAAVEDVDALVVGIAQAEGCPALMSLADQLRPDEPVPFMHPPSVTLAACLDCKHSEPLVDGQCTHVTVGQADNMDVVKCGHYCIQRSLAAYA